MAGWTSLKWLINDEIAQRREEGCCVDGFDKLLGEAGEDKNALMNVYEKLLALVPSSEFTYKEPDEYEEIKALSDGNIPSVKLDYDSDEVKDKFYGAWLGRCAGCALGKPFERYPYCGGANGRSGASYVKEWYRGRGRMAHQRLRSLSLRSGRTHRRISACSATTAFAKTYASWRPTTTYAT